MLEEIKKEVSDFDKQSKKHKYLEVGKNKRKETFSNSTFAEKPSIRTSNKPSKDFTGSIISRGNGKEGIESGTGEPELTTPEGERDDFRKLRSRGFGSGNEQTFNSITMRKIGIPEGVDREIDTPPSSGVVVGSSQVASVRDEEKPMLIMNEAPPSDHEPPPLKPFYAQGV